jgi:hypothetical protein
MVPKNRLILVTDQQRRLAGIAVQGDVVADE